MSYEGHWKSLVLCYKRKRYKIHVIIHVLLFNVNLKRSSNMASCLPHSSTKQQGHHVTFCVQRLSLVDGKVQVFVLFTQCIVLYLHIVGISLIAE